MIDAPIANEVNYDKISLEELQELGLNQKSKEDDNVYAPNDLLKKFKLLKQKDAFSFSTVSTKLHPP